MGGSSPLTAIEKKILLFFQEHPHAIETVRGISTWAGEPPEVARSALEVLVGKKWILTHETSAVTGYTLTGEEKLLIQIRDILGIS